LTSKLVCTNIAVVMEEDRKKLTEKKLLSCGKREFLEKGYAKANLRSICEASGVTTGAFYFSFASKEALLRAILAPFIADSRELLSGLARMEEEHPETADDNEIQIIRYLSAHREECIILMEKSAGSCYEHFHEEAAAMMQESFRRYYRKYLGAEPDPELIRILASMRLHGYLELVHGDYTMKERLFLARAIGIHADAGTLSLIQYLKEENDAHR